MNLILFAKAPVKGRVKTRLAASMGDAKALEIYLGLLRTALQAALKVQARRLLFLDGAITENFPKFPAAAFELHEQCGRDLGERMYTAFRQTAARYPEEPILLIGSDIPDLNAEILKSAFRQIGAHLPKGTPPPADLILGPTHDGGYYLIGLSATWSKNEKALSAIFKNKQWSHNRVFREALETAKTLGLRTSLAPRLYDIDSTEDLQQSLQNPSEG